MNKLFLLFCLPVLSCCVQDDIPQQSIQEKDKCNTNPDNGMQRIIVNSPDEINNIINSMESLKTPLSRAAITSGLIFSNNKDAFVSLLEADRNRVMASLTPEQIEEVTREGLMYEPSDSIIADLQFAELLNAEREIQVGDIVYKYYANGVAQVPAQYAYELQQIDEKVAKLSVNADNEGSVIPVNNHTTFTLIDYAIHKDIDVNTIEFGNGDGSGNNSGNSSWDPGNNPLIFQDGRVVPESCVRVIDYNGSNDGGWLQQLISGIFGKSVVAINHFSDHKKLTMHFYDQNYIIYSKIGTHLKMQEQKFLIWWNVNADELVQGWETVTIRYTLPKPIPPTTFTYPGLTNPTITTWCPFPFKDTNVLLFHIPFANYDFTTKDLNRAFQTAARKTFDAASAWSKKSISNYNDIGLMCNQNRYAYIIHGPYERIVYNKGSIESKFFSKWFPGECTLQFSFGSSVSFKGIKLDLNDHVDLYRGSVYGAILYKGQWRAARIIKNH